MFFSPHLGVFFGAGGSQEGQGYRSKRELSETVFFYILTIHKHQISYVKHVLGPLYVFFTLFGCLDGGKGLGHNLLMQFSTLGSSKIEIFNTDFFDILTILNDQVSYMQHVLNPLYVFLTLLWCFDGDGGLLNDFPTT